MGCGRRGTPQNASVRSMRCVAERSDSIAAAGFGRLRTQTSQNAPSRRFVTCPAIPGRALLDGNGRLRIASFRHNAYAPHRCVLGLVSATIVVLHAAQRDEPSLGRVRAGGFCLVLLVVLHNYTFIIYIMQYIF